MLSSPAAIPALLLLADGRFPAGGHVHSGGVEAAVADGRVGDLASLEAFTAGRLRTTGLVEAALAAATVHRLSGHATVARDTLAELDTEADGRILPAPLRQASRRLGRQLLRSSTRCWPSLLLDTASTVTQSGLHQPVALGTVARVVGIDPLGAAQLALHHAVATPTQAAVRLLGLDPFGSVAIAARLSPLVEHLAGVAADAAWGPLAGLPAVSSPLLEIAAVEHHRWDSHMFAT
jgi:urease accessory protein